MLSACHFRETSVYQWFHYENPTIKPVNLGNYRKLAEEAEKSGEKDLDFKNIPDPNLQIISHISNIIKHTRDNSRKYLSEHPPKKLYGIRVETTAPNGFQPPINLEEHHLDWIFDVVSRSGPLANPNRV
ncbi:hypothetical protein [Acetobacter oeni]|uniref:hypothetical protein n=1 Tax=Acetobacter oeni TaxID=304077 RepID=UPI0015696C0E|nr:hypothetical protein [Acetobacter oeni]MBB3882859.1 hypothetical protein [Acetobacter oeni]NHO18945.1 hypothetical protein [Acetobacter oeni]